MQGYVQVGILLSTRAPVNHNVYTQSAIHCGMRKCIHRALMYTCKRLGPFTAHARMLLIIMQIVLQPDDTILAPNITKGRYSLLNFARISPLYFAGCHEKN